MSMKQPSDSPPTPAEKRIARLLADHWDLLARVDRDAAILAAYSFGAELADEAQADGEEACGDTDDYLRVCVKFAWDAGVCNDVEVALWESEQDDPRHAAFQEGFRDRLRELTT